MAFIIFIVTCSPGEKNLCPDAKEDALKVFRFWNHFFFADKKVEPCCSHGPYKTTNRFFV